MAAVFSTNGVWYLTKDVIDIRVPLTILNELSTVVCSALWYLLAEKLNIENYVILNSIFKSILECLSFNSVTWFTYSRWDWLTIFEIITQWPAIILFTILHFIFSGFTIIYEYNMNANPIIYSLLYLSSFSSAAFSTNCVFLYISSFNSYGLYLGITLIGGYTNYCFTPNIL